MSPGITHTIMQCQPYTNSPENRRRNDNFEIIYGANKILFAECDKDVSIRKKLLINLCHAKIRNKLMNVAQ